ncbi:MAG: SigB/SigF/SigG family RNA polymerase sigma factor [Clostridiales bacterium]|jgi:RNA polymerase sporulation-specific sigma factor|nr:SigB/SigF/SigG family RNA polymerase sigma factor [Clostridiales bacterium]
MDKTIKLICRAQNNDRKAQEELIKQNTGLIWCVVKKFANRGHDLEDLFQIGSMGLLKCIKKFDFKTFDVKFSTYAVPMIIGEIKRFLRDDGMIRISRPLKELSIKIRKIQENYIKQKNKSPDLNELVDILKVSRDEILLAMESNRAIESLYQTIEQRDGQKLFLIDKINPDNDASFNILDKIAVNEILEKLNEDERELIMLRYFMDKTQAQVARKFSVTQVQISRLEKRILNKLKRYA